MSVVLAEVLARGETSPTWLSWVCVVLGAALVVVGVRSWFCRGEAQESPAWTRSLSDATPASALRLGFLLSAVNPKILLLCAAAGLAIGDAQSTAPEVVVAVMAVVLVVIGLVLVVIGLVVAVKGVQGL